MLAFLRSRAFLIAVGLVCFAVFVWFGGPELKYSDWTPLRSETVRMVVILTALLLVVGWHVWKRIKARSASQQLVTAVVAQAAAPDRPSREAQALRERFEEATARLKQNRRDGHTLYELPWYVIIGAPGSGKTTALVHSGLQFSVDQRSGRSATRGVGGTRNCDWWFTNEAVFIDTAGRYASQDSDPDADSAAWKEFLSLLKKYRQRRPINGVLLAISAQDLLTQSHERRDEHIEAARRRLTELNDEFGIQLPVYVLVTKCDLMAGFTEYFDDQSAAGRAQVWGVTFPYAQARNSAAAQAFPSELDALIQRLHERVMGRLEEERDVRRRARIFGFPQQVAALSGALSGFVREVFASTRFDRTILLRGVYLTSGTQEGTPIDRLLGSLGRRFAVAPEAVAPAGKGKAYFIQRLLQEVVIPEAGLAGVNRRVELRKAASQLGAYAALLAVAVLGVIALTVSYRGNRAYLASVTSAVAAFKASPAEPDSAPVEQLLPRLNAVKAVFDAANANRTSVPLHMRWGLYQGNTLGNDARDAYVDVLSGPLLTRIAERIKRRIVEYANDPLLVYEYLKGYLLLLNPGERDGRPHLRALADLEWEDPRAEESATGPALLQHFHNLLDESTGRLRAIPPDADTKDLITSARRAVRTVSIAELAFLGIRRENEGQGGTSMAVAGGPAARDVLRRKDGGSLSQPISHIFTIEGFDTWSSKAAIDREVKKLDDESWVWGGDGMPVENPAQIEARLFEIWSQHYIETWEDVIRNTDVQPMGGPEQTAASLVRLSGRASPLKLLLQTVARHTSLVKPKAAPMPTKSVTDSFLDRAKSSVAPITSRIGGAGPVDEKPVDMARRRITERFEPIRSLVASDGGDAPIDSVLMQLKALQETISAVGSRVGDQELDAPTQAAIRKSAADVRAAAVGLPEAIVQLVEQLTRAVEVSMLGNLRHSLKAAYDSELVIPCSRLVGTHYPIVPGTRDAALGDFGLVFGYDGLFDRFFKSRLERLVELSGERLRWKPGIGDGVPASSAMLRQFEAARAIRDAFFAPGSSKPAVTFSITPVSIGSLQRFLLDIDGQELQYRNEAPRSVPMKWPGEKDSGVQATFFDGSTVPPFAAYNGPWGLFRWLEDVQVRSESERRHLLTFTNKAHRVELRVEADLTMNPFDQRVLFRGFQCGI